VSDRGAPNYLRSVLVGAGAVVIKDGFDGRPAPALRRLTQSVPSCRAFCRGARRPALAVFWDSDESSPCDLSAQADRRTARRDDRRGPKAPETHHSPAPPSPGAGNRSRVLGRSEPEARGFGPRRSTAYPAWRVSNVATRGRRSQSGHGHVPTGGSSSSYAKLSSSREQPCPRCPQRSLTPRERGPCGPLSVLVRFTAVAASVSAQLAQSA
jgi:hypothetical protein